MDPVRAKLNDIAYCLESLEKLSIIFATGPYKSMQPQDVQRDLLFTFRNLASFVSDMSLSLVENHTRIEEGNQDV